VVAGGCSKKKASDTTTTPPPPPAASQPSTNSQPSGNTGGQAANPNELAAVVAKLTTQRSWRAQVTIETSGQPAQQANLEYVAPNRYHFTINAAGLGSLELISIGSDSYTKLGTTWMKQSGGGLGQLFDVESITDAVSNLDGYTKGGTANVNGKNCQLYSRTVAAETEEICVADDLPVRFVNQSGTEKVTVVFSDFNANITINAPI
jgi:hypothetical protein